MWAEEETHTPHGLKSATGGALDHTKDGHAHAEQAGGHEHSQNGVGGHKVPNLANQGTDGVHSTEHGTHTTDRLLKSFLLSYKRYKEQSE